MKRISRATLAGAVLICAGVSHAYAGQGFFGGMKVNGDIRAYDFTRHYSGPVAGQQAFSLGGALNVLSGSVYGFSAGLSFYTAHNLGLNNANPALVDGTLAGYRGINTLGQAFVQYDNRRVLVRAGDQSINNPWINASDSRMIPATYQALLAAVKPMTGLTISAMRITRFKSRTSDEFSQTDLYNSTSTFNIGGTGGLAGGHETGVAAVGADYHGGGLKTAVWGYQFYDLAKMAYAQGSYVLPGAVGLKPFVGAQVLRETGSGPQYLGPVDATVYGAVVGIKHAGDELSLGYDDLPAHADAFGNGDVVSPYTTGYATDPLYTTSMIQGMIDRKTTGHALKVSATAYLLQHRIRLIASFADYFNTLYSGYGSARTNEADLDLTYFLSGPLKGLSIRDRIGIAHNLPVVHRFVYNRLMLEYDF
ncbi:OprD family outer membrane porin [Acidiferrobacter sp.]|uniref:OprD family outer membrane porin n=1 Tax=Acidiferrobacter sp. TaxID=1872107 RepID=UPI00260B1E59|nr:OprD family outer membrane porin [Acidiferrobacter sp.]